MDYGEITHQSFTKDSEKGETLKTEQQNQLLETG